MSHNKHLKTITKLELRLTLTLEAGDKGSINGDIIVDGDRTPAFDLEAIKNIYTDMGRFIIQLEADLASGDEDATVTRTMVLKDPDTGEEIERIEETVSVSTPSKMS